MKTLRVKASRGFGICVFLVSTLWTSGYSEQFDIHGRVLDKEGKGVPGAIASLQDAGLSDTTGADGAYHLVGSVLGGIASVPAAGRSGSPVFRNGLFSFTVTDKAAAVSVAVHDLRGRRIHGSRSHVLPRGEYKIALFNGDEAIVAHGTYIAVLQIGECRYHARLSVIEGLQCMSGPSLTTVAGASSDYGVHLAKGVAEDALDSLVLVRDGQLLKTTGIAQYNDTIPDVFIVQRDIYGDVPGVDASTAKVLASLGGPDFKDKRVELWINRPNSSYSGFVYFLYSPAVVTYSVGALALNEMGRITGASEVVEFPSTAGDIQIPAFSPVNAVPSVSGTDTTVGINDTFHLVANVTDGYGTIEEYLWRVGGGEWFPSDGDTAFVAPSTPQSIVCSLKVVDDDGNVKYWMRTVTVEVRPPTADAGGPYVVGINDAIALRGAGTDESMVAKYEWKFWGSSWIETSSGDTDVVAPSQSGLWVCSLRVTDDDGNVALDEGSVFVSDGRMRKISDTNSPIGALLVDTTEVTQLQYAQLMAATYPNYESPPWSIDSGLGDDYPAYFVTFDDAILYCNAKTRQAGSLDTVYSYSEVQGVPGNGCFIPYPCDIDTSKCGYRLLTTEEWEYACRGGTSTEHYWEGGNAEDHEWYVDNSGMTAHMVAQKQPNGYGLYDMAGNVREWSRNVTTDWVALSGGSYAEDLLRLRSAYWRGTEPSIHSAQTGFRCCIRAR